MRAKVVIPAVVSIALVVAVLAAVPGPVRNPQSTTDTVSVTLQCPGNDLLFQTNSWSTTLSLGDSVVWLLTDDSHADYISVQLKRGRWPFTRERPVPGRKAGSQNVPASSGGRANRRGTYQYNISLECNNRTIVIDPEMIIEED